MKNDEIQRVRDYEKQHVKDGESERNWTNS